MTRKRGAEKPITHSRRLDGVIRGDMRRDLKNRRAPSPTLAGLLKRLTDPNGQTVDLDDLVAEWRDECRAAVEAGVIGAVKDAVRSYCDSNESLPPWIVPIVLHMLELAEPHVKASMAARGRTTTAIQRHDQNMLHFKRWRTVKEIRAYQEWYKLHVTRRLRAKRITNAERAKLARLVNLGSTWDQAYSIAVEQLRGTAAGSGGPDAVQSSYKLVQQAIKNGSAAQYHLTSDWLLAGANGPNRGK